MNVTTTLVNALKEVESLINDLSASIIIEPGYYEREWVRTDGGHHGAGERGDSFIQEQATWIEAKTEPDIQKRNVAQNRLQTIFDSSVWYSVKYKAGEALSKTGLEPQLLSEWIEQLGKNIGESSEIKKEDARLRAIDDAIELYRLSESPRIRDLIRNSYENSNSSKIRIKSGKGLGYCSLRIWFHELLIK